MDFLCHCATSSRANQISKSVVAGRQFRRLPANRRVELWSFKKRRKYNRTSRRLGTAVAYSCRAESDRQLSTSNSHHFGILSSLRYSDKLDKCVRARLTIRTQAFCRNSICIRVRTQNEITTIFRLLNSIPRTSSLLWCQQITETALVSVSTPESLWHIHCAFQQTKKQETLTQWSNLWPPVQVLHVRRALNGQLFCTG